MHNRSQTSMMIRLQYCSDTLSLVWKEIRWVTLLNMVGLHLAAFYGMMFKISSCKWETLLFSFLLWYAIRIGIAGGHHRLWSHRSYKAHWTLRVLFMILVSMGMEGPIYEWACNHRVHHKHSETNADPHNVRIHMLFNNYLNQSFI